MPFADHAAAALAPIYAEFGDAATWSGVASPVMVIRVESQPDLRFGNAGGRVRAESVLLYVRISEVSAPAAGDVVIIVAGPVAGRRYQLLRDAQPELDEFGFEWTCEAERLP